MNARGDREPHTTDESVRQLNARQAELLDSVGRLAGGIAHDFNNLLATIAGYGELLEMQLQKRANNAAELKDLAEIQDAARRAQEQTQRLLSFAQRIPSRPQLLEPQEIVKGIERVLLRLAPPGVRFVATVAPASDVINVDRPQFERVITYLVVNGYDAMRNSEGVLTLNAEWRDATSHGLPHGIVMGHADNATGVCLDLSVTDTGAGMTESQVRQAFQPYETTRSDQEIGLGLGLPAVYGLVAKAGGVIVVDSRPASNPSDGAAAGTTVHVLIPRSPSAQGLRDD